MLFFRRGPNPKPTSIRAKILTFRQIHIAIITLSEGGQTPFPTSMGGAMTGFAPWIRHCSKSRPLNSAVQIRARLKPAQITTAPIVSAPLIVANLKHVFKDLVLIKHLNIYYFVYSDSARNSRTLLIRHIYTRRLEASGPRPLLRPEAFRRSKPCRRRTLRLGRMPTVRLQSTGIALSPSVSTPDSGGREGGRREGRKDSRGGKVRGGRGGRETDAEANIDSRQNST